MGGKNIGVVFFFSVGDFIVMSVILFVLDEY